MLNQDRMFFVNFSVNFEPISFKFCKGHFLLNPLSIHDAIRHHFPTTKGFMMTISLKLIYQYMAIFFNFLPTSSHLHSLQVENCDSNSWLVVDEDDNGKFRLERVKILCPNFNILHLRSFLQLLQKVQVYWVFFGFCIPAEICNFWTFYNLDQILI